MSDRERHEPWPPNEGESRLLLGAARLDELQARARRDLAIERVLSSWRESRRSNGGIWLLALGGILTLALACGAWWLVSTRPTTLAPEPSRARAPASSIGGPVLYRPACRETVQAPASTALIDDMEDGDAIIVPRDARGGMWRLSFDGTGPITPFAGNLLPDVIPGGRGPSQMALHVFGGRLIEWGAFVSTSLTPSGCYDASAYAGIEFWARGTRRLHIGVVMMDVVSTLVGGPCVENCNGGHMQTIDLTPEWKRYSLRWSELAPEAAKGNLALDLRRLSSVTFGVSPADTPFDVWLDDLAFLPP
jgi:hypothetical protein